MVVVVVAASGTITFVPVAVLTALLTTATLSPSHRRCQSSAAKKTAPDDKDVKNDGRGMVVVMVDVAVVAGSAIAVAAPPR